MKKTWWLLLAMACAHAPQRAPDNVERVDVYTEPAGARVDLVHLGGGRCVLHVTGSNSVLDGVAFACTRTETDRAIIFAIDFDGRRSESLQIHDRATVTLYPPRRRDGIVVKLDVAAGERFDPAPVLTRHHQQQDSGQLAQLAKFDRPLHLTWQQDALAESVKAASTACSATLGVEFDWNLTDAELADGRYPIDCGSMFDRVANLCRAPSGKDFVQRHVSRVRCERSSTRQTVVRLDGKTLVAHLGEGTPDDFLQDALANFGASPDAPPVPWGDGKSLHDRLALDQISVCANAQGQFIASTSEVHVGNEPYLPQLFVGDRERVSLVPNDPRYPDYFIDGRQLRKAEVNPVAERDLAVPGKFISEVRMDHFERKGCELRCGERLVKLTMLSAEEVHRLLPARRVVPPPFDRKPHALLRDRSGAYYYVDTSTLAGREKDFRVWVGPRGKMKPLQLVNSLSDSEGDLFTTKTGELRLSLDRHAPSFWLEGKKKVELKVVPTNENLDVIFVELGVYTGARLGTPCDDL